MRIVYTIIIFKGMNVNNVLCNRIKFGLAQLANQIGANESNISSLTSALSGKASTAVATTSANGLMSSGDKTIVNALSSNTYTAMTSNSPMVSTTRGGYIIIGKLCIINVLFESTGSSPKIFKNVPIPADGSVYVQLIPLAEGSNIILGSINALGLINPSYNIPEGTYTINAVYLIA